MGRRDKLKKELHGLQVLRVQYKDENLLQFVNKEINRVKNELELMSICKKNK